MTPTGLLIFVQLSFACLPAPDGGWDWTLAQAYEHVSTAEDRGVSMDHFQFVPSGHPDYASVKARCS